ncbi:hypothetical protein IFM89_035042 [Coptis chinensis]|uniref:F-box domain-containing protein n=1 Tax=Coptis chinensis TaxID=261450 RepID=A0A835LPK0_9MAGN|nr:hypothetical protein IFM89_035042 [Coptis chinensis]
MALQMKFGSLSKYGSWNEFDFDEMDKDFGVVRCTGAFGRKRVEPSPCSSPFRTPLKRQCSVKLNFDKSLLEALPQDILVRILCGVEHDDLEKLQYVSRSIRDATLIAKNWHFAYHTPSSKTASLKSFRIVDDEYFDSHPTPNAPGPGKGHWSRTKGRNLSDISVALFHSPETDRDSRLG